jgi:hypothetical protein
MDQITRDAIESGIPGLELPEAYMLVVPTGDKHDEDLVFKEAHTLKKKLSEGVLPPSQERAFTDCIMMIVVLDEERHAKKALHDNRKWMMTDFFKFYKEGGKANINVLRAQKEKGPKERKFRKRGRCGA